MSERASAASNRPATNPASVPSTIPSAPAMTAEEARERLGRIRVVKLRRGDEVEAIRGSRAQYDADAAALALAIRALELVPKLAACEALPFGGGRRAVLLTGTTWDDLRALAAEGGA
jgi:hypothetical protein